MYQIISREIYGIHNKKEIYIPWVKPKTEEQKQRITEKNIFITKHFRLFLEQHLIMQIYFLYDFQDYNYFCV